MELSKSFHFPITSKLADLPGVKVERRVSALSPGIHICTGLDQDLDGAQVVVGAREMQGGVSAKTALLSRVDVIHLPLLDQGLQPACVSNTGELKKLLE